MTFNKKEWGGYLTDKEKISVERFEELVYNVGWFEEEHFTRRSYEEVSLCVSQNVENIFFLLFSLTC